MFAANLLDIIIFFLSNASIIMLMFIVVMVASCFLGRNIMITKKMVIASLGVVLASGLINCCNGWLLKIFQPDLYADIINERITEEVLKQYFLFSSKVSAILSYAVYVYVFIIFLFAYQEKKLVRAIESILCFYLIILFSGLIMVYEFIYSAGGKWETFIAIETRYGRTYIAWNNAYAITSFCFYALVLAILYFGFYRKKIRYSIQLRYKILFIVWFIAFLIIPFIPFDMENDDMALRYQSLCHVMAIFIPLLGVFAPILLVMGVTAKALKEKNEAQEQYLSAELEYIERYKNTQTQTRAFRHDIINNLTLTTMLMDQGKTQEAKEHLEELLGNVQALSPQFVTGDEMLDCIVSMKAEKMTSKGIAFTADGIADGGLHMKPMDVCGVFANALDNAIEAATETKDPSIAMQIKRTDKFFVVNIENSVAEKIDLEKLMATDGYTTKKNKEHHGFGLQNIRRIVEKNDGLVQIKSLDDRFSLSIMIPRTVA